jgi:hypothetical protein
LESAWYLTFLILGAVSQAQGAENLGQLKLSSEKVAVLGGRLMVSVPSSAISQAMQHGIMAAPESEFEQTRIVIDAGGQRMVLMAYELFTRTGADFETVAQNETAGFPVKVRTESWSGMGQLRAMAYFPLTPTKDRAANLVMGVFVAQPDGTVQSLIWYVNPEGAKAYDGALSLARSMAKTIASGKRNLEVRAGERELSGYSATKNVFIRVPAGYVATVQHGPDFIVHHIHKLTAFGSPGASVGIYLGWHPSNEHEGFQNRGTSVLFGKRVQWYEKTADEDGHKTTFAKALVPLGSGSMDAPSYADVFLEAGDASTIEELKSVAATLRLGDRTTLR